MKLISKTIDIPQTFIPSDSFIVIDIETTGLSYKNKIIIIGLLIIEELKPQGTFMQFFNDDGHSEIDLLLSFIETIKLYNKYYFISFNGNAFDFSFINARLSFNKIDFQLSKFNNIDLLALARSHKQVYSLSSLNLKSIESFYSIHRIDTISGKESVDLYKTYLITKKDELKHLILTHNEDDIMNLWPLFCTMKGHLHLNLPISFMWNHQYYYIQSVTFMNDYLCLHFSLPAFYQLKDIFINRLGLSLTTHKTYYELKLPIIHDPQNALYIFNTEDLLGLQFQSLDNQSKQNYIAKYGNLLYTDNIIQIVKSCLGEFK